MKVLFVYKLALQTFFYHENTSYVFKGTKELSLVKGRQNKSSFRWKNTVENSLSSHVYAAILKITHPQCNAIIVRTPPVSKSCSLDPLAAVLLKENFDMLLPTLCRIVNLSLESGYVPPSLKTAVLLPLLKKPSLDHEILSNYRPISNLKVISKIIEKVVAVRLQDYLESNQLNEPLQSAYK